MMTTVALNDRTLQLLKSAKDQTNAKNYDELIHKLVLQMKAPKKSMRGMAKSTKEFEREEIDRFA